MYKRLMCLRSFILKTLKHLVDIWYIRDGLTGRIKKAGLTFRACSRAIERTCGLTPRSVRGLYTRIVKLALSYGGMVVKIRIENRLM